jgi:LPXTG-site transpeptidase (sortase) family protein
VAGLCPYLGLDGNPNDVLLVPSPNHRCYVRRTPERVGNEHQAAVCLTSSYRRCPRLQSVVKRHERQMAGPSGGQARLSTEHPNLHAARAGRRRTGKRGPLTLTEALVVTLVAGILLSFAFVGYAAFYRARVGPGLAAATSAIEDVVAPTSEPPPTWTPTLLPSPTTQVTGQPPPSATVEVIDPAPPTAIPTPILPTATAAVRPPADSPPTRLVISAIDLDVSVNPVQIVQIGEGSRARTVWGASPDAGGFHYTSAYPGNPGNTVINGHRDIHAAVFRNLDQVEVGDPIRLYVGERLYPYVATEILVVPETFASAKQRAENLRLIGYMPEERLTLITCTPVGLATHRLLVIAKPAGSGELVDP